jgi:hypothetical protein
LLKDDKLHPAVQRQLYSTNNSNEKRQEYKQKEPLANVSVLQKDSIIKSALSNSNNSHVQQNNEMQIENKESLLVS